jgi:hypothetical protein
MARIHVPGPVWLVALAGLANEERALFAIVWYSHAGSLGGRRQLVETRGERLVSSGVRSCREASVMSRNGKMMGGEDVAR